MTTREARLVSGKGFADLHIPHWLVLAIIGAQDAPPIGFIWDDDDAGGAAVAGRKAD